MKILLGVTFILFTLNLFSQKSQLDLAEIMTGDSFIGHSPQNIRWSAFGEGFYFERQNDSTETSNLYHYHIRNDEFKKISEKDEPGIPFFHSNLRGKSNFFYLKEDDLRLCDIKDNEVFLKIRSLEKKSELQHVLNPNKVYYRSGANLFSFDSQNAQLMQITNFREEKTPEEKTKSYLERQEEMLFEYFRNEDKSKDAEKPQYLKPVYIGEKVLNSISISPNEDFIMYLISDKSTPNPTEYTEFLRREGYIKMRSARPKVGNVEAPNYEMNIYHLERDTIIPLDFSFLSGIRKRPEYQKEYGLSGKLSEDKAIIIHKPVFNEKGNKAIISVKSFDNKDRWLIIYDHTDGTLTEIEHQHYEAWIGGPGISNWNYSTGNIGWIGDEKIYYHSEVTGYSHLYLNNIHTKESTALTSGTFEIYDAQLSQDGNYFYITANKSHPGNRSFYKLDWKRKIWKDILTEDGNYEVSVSPDEKHLAIRYSYRNQPWELFLAKNETNTKLRQITHSTTENFNSYKWRSPELINFKASDGETVHARLYKPEKANGSAVIFVHGAGYLQNAHNWWSSYHREYMFHNLLADLGYTILDIDYRGSKGYGRDFRTAIYRHMGGRDLADQMDGKRWLVENQGIKSDRVGIYGGSYGGFITLMALFKEPGEFQCGGALRSVTDWAHYNHGYTSNILNTPEQDSIAFQRSSPIYFAEGLEDRLIMFHGMIDDNVQYQDVIRLTQRFIELGKTDWDLVSYPTERHGFKSTSAWHDEYRRLLEMFNHNLLKND